MDATPETSLVARASQAFARLSDREKRLVLITAAVAVVLLVIGTSVLVGNALDSRQKSISMHKGEIEQLNALRGKYDDAVAVEKRNNARIRSNLASLSSVITKATSELGLQVTDLNERRIPVKDSDVQEVDVDVNLKEISVDKLDTLLEKLEGTRTEGVVKVSKLKVKTRFDNPDMLEIAMTVTTWKSSGAPGKDDGKPEGANP